MHMPRTVSVHMDGHNQPSPWEAKGVCGFRAGARSSESKVQGDMNQRITPRPRPPREKKRIKQLLSHALALPSSLFLLSCTIDAQQQHATISTWLRVWISFIIQPLLFTVLSLHFSTACLTL